MTHQEQVLLSHLLSIHHLVGPMAKTPTSRADDPGFDSCLHRGDLSRWSHTCGLKIGAPVTTLPGAWHYRVSAGTGWPGVSVNILWLGEVESLICNSISVWQHVNLSEQIRPWATLSCCWDIKQSKNNNNSYLFPVSILYLLNMILCFVKSNEKQKTSKEYKIYP